MRLTMVGAVTFELAPADRLGALGAARGDVLVPLGLAGGLPDVPAQAAPGA
jgi:hypothetical protein